MNKAFIGLSVIGVPVSVAGALLGWSSIVMFIIYCLTIIALAGLIGTATESLAIVLGPRIGGLMNATFGNAVELIISFFALKKGLIEVVLASFTGSVIGNLLLVGGLSFFIGGLKYKEQHFNVDETQHNSGMLFFAVLVAFLIPEVFSRNMNEDDTIFLSVGISIILIIAYLGALLFKFVTHRGVYQKKDKNKKDQNKKQEEEPDWGKWVAVTVLAVSTIAVAYVSHNLVDTFEVVGREFGLSELFIGVIIVAIVGNAAEHASAVMMAYKDKMNVALEIAVGSTLQVAMFVIPVLMLISLMFTPMPLVFTWPELASMATGVLLVTMISNDGDSNWFDGLVLLAAYLIMGIGFYFI